MSENDIRQDNDISEIKMRLDTQDRRMEQERARVNGLLKEFATICQEDQYDVRQMMQEDAARVAGRLDRLESNLDVLMEGVVKLARGLDALDEIVHGTIRKGAENEVRSLLLSVAHLAVDARLSKVMEIVGLEPADAQMSPEMVAAALPMLERMNELLAVLAGLSAAEEADAVQHPAADAQSDQEIIDRILEAVAESAENGDNEFFAAHEFELSDEDAEMIETVMGKLGEMFGEDAAEDVGIAIYDEYDQIAFDDPENPYSGLCRVALFEGDADQILEQLLEYFMEMVANGLLTEEEADIAFCFPAEGIKALMLRARDGGIDIRFLPHPTGITQFVDETEAATMLIPVSSKRELIEVGYAVYAKSLARLNPDQTA